MASRALLVGNRLALLGALLYLSEWIVIPFLPELPTDKLGEDAASIVTVYSARHGRGNGDDRRRRDVAPDDGADCGNVLPCVLPSIVPVGW